MGHSTNKSKKVHKEYNKGTALARKTIFQTQKVEYIHRRWIKVSHSLNKSASSIKQVSGCCTY